jgi:hypothetical protein
VGNVLAWGDGEGQAMAETARQSGSVDPCADVGVIWYSSCRSTMENVVRNSGSALPPPAPFDFTPLIVLAAIAAGAVLFWMQRAGIRSVAARWLGRPIASVVEQTEILEKNQIATR